MTQLVYVSVHTSTRGFAYVFCRRIADYCQRITKCSLLKVNNDKNLKIYTLDQPSSRSYKCVCCHRVLIQKLA